MERKNRTQCKKTVISKIVKGLNPAPHIHEHLRYTIMATALRTPSRITTSRLSTLRWMTRTPSRTRTRTTRSSEHAARRPLMHSGLTSHLWLKIASCVSSMSSMHAHLWLVSWVVCLLPCVLRFLICGKSLNVQKNLEFFIVKIGYSWRQSTVTDGGCRGIISYTSYSRTKDYVKLHIMATTTSTLSQTRWTT